MRFVRGYHVELNRSIAFFESENNICSCPILSSRLCCFQPWPKKSIQQHRARVDRVYNDNKSCPFVSTRVQTLFSMYFNFLLSDLLPNRCDFDSVTMPSQRHKRTVYTAEQKSTLEATFRNKMYLSREEKATLASKLSVGIAKVQVCSG